MSTEIGFLLHGRGCLGAVRVTKVGVLTNVFGFVLVIITTGYFLGCGAGFISFSGTFSFFPLWFAFLWHGTT
jgi:hypothetical protein